MSKALGIGGFLVILFLGIIALAVVGGLLYFGGVIGHKPASIGGVTSDLVVEKNGVMCPSDLDTSLTPNVYNQLNTTGSENFDVGYRMYLSDGSFITSGTDTTAPTAINVDCAKTYVFRLLSADGDEGDNAKILAVEGEGATIIEDGRAVKFVAQGANYMLNIYASQHGVLEMRAYDKMNAGWMYDTGDASAVDWETTGVVFESTTNNATDLAVGTAGEVDVEFSVRATRTDTDFNDLGVFILEDADTTKWNIPVIRADGSKLTDVKGGLDVNEARLWAGYEYVYFVDTPVQDDTVKVEANQKALAGVNPTTSDDLGFVFATKGAFKATSGSDVKYSGATDASPAAAVFTVQTATLAIS